MRKLYGWLGALLVVFTAAMALATWSVYARTWPLGAGSGAVFVVFLAGAAIIPGPLRALSGPRLQTAKALVQAFGSVCAGEFFLMGLVTWVLGKRSIPDNNAYDVLGLLIFLGLLGVGIQGAVAMIGRFVYVRNRQLVVPRFWATAHDGGARAQEGGERLPH